MKIFPNKFIRGLRISRTALRHYSLYRRASLGGATDMTALEDFHVYESLGQLPEDCTNFTAFSKTNAYANGKWIMRLTQDQIQEDVMLGNFTKSEFINSSSLNRELASGAFRIKRVDVVKFKFSASGWFTEKLVRNLHRSTLFPYTKEFQ